jgi:hypothetical protein
MLASQVWESLRVDLTAIDPALVVFDSAALGSISFAN